MVLEEVCLLPREVPVGDVEQALAIVAAAQHLEFHLAREEVEVRGGAEHFEGFIAEVADVHLVDRVLVAGRHDEVEVGEGHGAHHFVGRGVAGPHLELLADVVEVGVEAVEVRLHDDLRSRRHSDCVTLG